MNTLTKKEENALVVFSEMDNPSHEEIGDAIDGGGSPMGRYYIAILKRKGFVEAQGGKHRSTRLTEQGKQYLAERG